MSSGLREGSDQASSAAEQRLDSWLCNARFAKSRNLAQALIARGKVRLNRERIAKPSHCVRAGDVLTLSLGPRVRVIEVRGFAAKRGSASIAADLYMELTPAPVRTKASPAGARPGEADGDDAAAAVVRWSGSGRPTKRDRRRIDRLKPGFDEA